MAKDFLGLSIDTNQILNIKDFIRKSDENGMSAPLSTTFQDREKEKKDIIESLDKNSVTIITGNAGVGKTRLVLESIQEFALTRNFELLCVKNNNLGLYDDLVASTERPGNYLFFVDDANELAELDLILDYTTEKQYGYDVRIIVTVRDYDIDRIKALWQSNNFIKYFDYFLYNFTEVKFYKWRIGSTFKEILTHDSVDSITKQHQQEWLTHIITQNASND